ncbi:MAG: ABC transporter substrate-binding protein [Hyphomicrobiales bacterium]|nr:ABC transporter substrate-binding protein [Hyphomicrobiales bacterium]
MKRREFLLMLAGAVAGPRVARAQRSSPPVVGFLSSGSESTFRQFASAFRGGLESQGLKLDQDATIEYRWSEGRYDNLERLADDLVRRRVSVIAATGGVVSAQAAIKATRDTPIVFVVGFDPVHLGLVSSLARPTGNATGISMYTTELATKRLEILHDLIPRARKIGLLVNPGSVGTTVEVETSHEAAQRQGIELVPLHAATSGEIADALARAKSEQVGALVVSADPFFTSSRKQIVALAAQHAIPTIYPFRAYVEDGGLASYGTEPSWAYRQAGLYAGRILKGSKPTELPVMLPTAFNLAVNLQTMRSLGITLPLDITVRAEIVGDTDPAR